MKKIFSSLAVLFTALALSAEVVSDGKVLPETKLLPEDGILKLNVSYRLEAEWHPVCWRVFGYAPQVPESVKENPAFKCNPNKDPKWTSYQFIPVQWLSKDASLSGTKALSLSADFKNLPPGDYKLMLGVDFRLGKTDRYFSPHFPFTITVPEKE